MAAKTSATERPGDFLDDLSVQDNPNALKFVFSDGKLVLSHHELPASSELDTESLIPLGTYQGKSVLAGVLKGKIPDGLTAWNVRATYGVLPDDLFGLAGLAHQVTEFHRTHRYCGACATELQSGDPQGGLGRYRRCPHCGLSVYPRVAPAVIVLISRGEGPDTEFLLARGPRQAPGVYTTLAGFVEPSETLENAVQREILEEVGVHVGNIRYQFSQPWPFPHSLMLAFTARYDSGEITPQPGEIEDAQWFPALQLPSIPPPFTSSRRLIDEALSTLSLTTR
ncbi:NAD(+) diphosphatase [Deinococcus cavernae]|uniref:NAD-capped RNA hydrolase NudC n=1 Tax=Deinococcus cavernae TaxID=2320857 RepID=A0A418VCV1_9DEIO|nr:NAD(+) diphosphatase [Deinococcus cavernae]